MDSFDIALLFVAEASKRCWARASSELLVCLCLCPNLISQNCSPLRPICSVAIEILNHWRRFVSVPRYISRLRELLRHHPLNPALSMLAFWIWSLFLALNGLGKKKRFIDFSRLVLAQLIENVANLVHGCQAHVNYLPPKHDCHRQLWSPLETGETCDQTSLLETWEPSQTLAHWECQWGNTSKRQRRWHRRLGLIFQMRFQENDCEAQGVSHHYCDSSSQTSLM